MSIDRITSVLICVFIGMNIFTLSAPEHLNNINIEVVNISDSNDTYIDLTKEDDEPDGYVLETNSVEPFEGLTDYEIDLISRVVMAEAEGEPLDGKIYVIDTILNRVDSPYFPNTIYNVIYQPHQFSSMWNGRYDRCTSNYDLNNLIIKEYTNRTNNDIVFFTADKYGEYGSPSFSVANHYFSTYR